MSRITTASEEFSTHRLQLSFRGNGQQQSFKRSEERWKKNQQQIFLKKRRKKTLFEMASKHHFQLSPDRNQNQS